jgi:hypothetical protein
MILEQIIRQVLLEAESGVLKLASKKQFAKAMAAGAKFAYAVKTKGTSDPQKIKMLVVNMSGFSSPVPGTVTSDEAQESAKTLTYVGPGGPYANKKYIYVMSQPESDKRQLINVWIMPKPAEFSRVFGTDEPAAKKSGEKEKSLQAVTVVKSSYNIGDARLLTVKEYNVIAQQVGVKQLQIESEKDLDTATIRPKQVNYPYQWETQGETIDVYTIPEELNKNTKDTYVYIQGRSKKWLQYPKLRFETFLSGDPAYPEFQKLTPDAMRITVEEKEDLLDELKFNNDISTGKETPLSPEGKAIRDWNKQKDKLDKEFKKINDKFWPTISPLQNRLEQLKLTGPEKDLEKVQKEYDDEIASADGRAWLKAKQAVDNHEKTRPESEFEKAKRQTTDAEKLKQTAIDTKAIEDAKLKAAREDKYTDADIIAATKKSSATGAEPNDITKWFQELILYKLKTQPNLIMYLKNSSTGDKYTPYELAQPQYGNWGDRSKELTIDIKKLFKKQFSTINGLVTDTYIKLIKLLDTMSIPAPKQK